MGNGSTLFKPPYRYGSPVSVVDMVDGRVWLLLAFVVPILLWSWTGRLTPFETRADKDGWNRAILVWAILFMCIALALSGAFG